LIETLTLHFGTSGRQYVTEYDKSPDRPLKSVGVTYLFTAAQLYKPIDYNFSANCAPPQKCFFYFSDQAFFGSKVSLRTARRAFASSSELALME
jgi:hypothetical protein